MRHCVVDTKTVQSFNLYTFNLRIALIKYSKLDQSFLKTNTTLIGRLIVIIITVTVTHFNPSLGYMDDWYLRLRRLVLD